MGVALAVGLQGQAGERAGRSRLRQGKCHTEEEVQATGTVCSELSLQQGLGCSVFLTDSAVESRVCFWGKATPCRPGLSPCSPNCQLLLTFVPQPAPLPLTLLPVRAPALCPKHGSQARGAGGAGK